MVIDYILDIYQANYIQSLGKTFSVGDYYLFYTLAEVLSGINRDTVAAVYTCTFDVFHYARDKEVGAVSDSVYLNLGAHHIFVYKDRIFQLLSSDYLHVLYNIAVTVCYYHILSA